MYVLLRRYEFVATVINNERRKVKTVWSGNKENVIPTFTDSYILHPTFTDSYSILLIPEQG